MFDAGARPAVLGTSGSGIRFPGRPHCPLSCTDADASCACCRKAHHARGLLPGASGFTFEHSSAPHAAAGLLFRQRPARASPDFSRFFRADDRTQCARCRLARSSAIVTNWGTLVNRIPAIHAISLRQEDGPQDLDIVDVPTRCRTACVPSYLSQRTCGPA